MLIFCKQLFQNVRSVCKRCMRSPWNWAFIQRVTHEYCSDHWKTQESEQLHPKILENADIQFFHVFRWDEVVFSIAMSEIPWDAIDGAELIIISQGLSPNLIFHFLNLWLFNENSKFGNETKTMRNILLSSLAFNSLHW